MAGLVYHFPVKGTIVMTIEERERIRQRIKKIIWSQRRRQTSFLDLPGAQGKHKHVVLTQTGPFSYIGPAPEAWKKNPKAHGDQFFVYECSCGATKIVNQNGEEKEHGKWKVSHG